MARLSLSQPEHRRPSWARSHSAYKAYIFNPPTLRSARPDFGMDNFSFDDAHLDKWVMPIGISDGLPSKLVEMISDWCYSGAAIDTALERIDRLEDESTDRAFPSTTHDHLIPSRRDSVFNVNVVGIENPPTIQLDSPLSSFPSNCAVKPLITSLQQLPAHITDMVGMESPPFTPVCNRSGARSPAVPTGSMDGMKNPDFQHVSAHLHSLSFSSSSTSASSLQSSLTRSPSLSDLPAAFDPTAWRHYVNTYKAELEDLRQNALTRFQGYRRRVDLWIAEVDVEPDMDPREKQALCDFLTWWIETKDRVAEYEVKVHALRAPKWEVALVEQTVAGP